MEKTQGGSDGHAASGARIERVLVVDDDEEFLGAVEHLGRNLLLEPVIARSAKEALAAASARPPQIALLDVTLAAGDDAFALARRLREQEGLAHLPLAFVSAGADLETRVAAVHAGASLFLTKPVDPAALDGAVRQLLAIARSHRARVLLVEPDRDFLRSAASVLAQEGLDVATLEDARSLLPLLDEARPDLLLLDVRLPGASGIDLCSALRASPRWSDLPIILLADDGSSERRVAAFEAGADDYLVKPVLRGDLLARIKVRVERDRLRRERTERDALTGLHLRAPFLDALAARIAEAGRKERRLSLCLLDLDHFKRVNDDHGHLAGDQVLAAIGKLLLSRLRTEDLRARWGGEEFALAFPGESAEAMHHVVDRVLEELRAIEFRGDQGEPFHVTFSGGFASFPDDGGDLRALFRVADRRLYAAKSHGRARVEAGG